MRQIQHDSPGVGYLGLLNTWQGVVSLLARIFFRHTSSSNGVNQQMLSGTSTNLLAISTDSCQVGSMR